MNDDELKNIIESLLFSYGEPISIKDIKNVLENRFSIKEIEKEIEILANEYDIQKRGISILKLEDKYQMCSNKIYIDYNKRLLEPKKRKTLSQATLETLTIIIYKQPITKVEIEDIRGVKCDKTLQTLLDNNLIFEAGRLNKIGKPIIYETTTELLKLLNVESLSVLPNLPTY
ncbi:MAG: SMC-Scp complex subunit ScpB [Peptostreptococcaceae bacterium]